MIEFIVFWLVCAFVSYKLIEYWWTDNLDWTGSEAFMAGFLSLLLGPLHVLIALALIVSRFIGNRPFNKKVLKTKRNNKWNY